MTPQLFSGRSDQAEISLKSRKGSRHVWDNPSSCFLARHIFMAHREHGRLYSGNWTTGKGWKLSSSSRACHLSQVTHQKAHRQGTRQRGRLERSPGCYGRSWYRRVLAKDKGLCSLEAPGSLGQEVRPGADSLTQQRYRERHAKTDRPGRGTDSRRQSGLGLELADPHSGCIWERNTIGSYLRCTVSPTGIWAARG